MNRLMVAENRGTHEAGLSRGKSAYIVNDGFEEVQIFRLTIFPCLFAMMGCFCRRVSCGDSKIWLEARDFVSPLYLFEKRRVDLNISVNQSSSFSQARKIVRPRAARSQRRASNLLKNLPSSQGPNIIYHRTLSSMLERQC